MPFPPTWLKWDKQSGFRKVDTAGEAEQIDERSSEPEKKPWWQTKKALTGAVSACVASTIFFTGWGVHLGDSTYLTRTYGTPGQAADGMYSGLDSFFGLQAQIKGDDGHGRQVTYNGSDSMGVTDNGLLYAPKPTTEFRNETCSTEPTNGKIGSVEPPRSVGSRSPGWWAPSLLSKTQVVQGATVVPSGFNNGNVSLPAAPGGVWYASGSPLSSNSGASILAGHINLNNGNLSPWGYLHRLDKCAHIYINDEHGDRREFVVTSLYLIKQDELAKHSELWRKDGDKKAYFITCSGNSIGTDGTQEAESTFLFNYEYNLIVEGTPVDGSYPKTESTENSTRKPVITEIPSVSTPSPAATPTSTPSPTSAAALVEPALTPEAAPATAQPGAPTPAEPTTPQAPAENKEATKVVTGTESSSQSARTAEPVAPIKVEKTQAPVTAKKIETAKPVSPTPTAKPSPTPTNVRTIQKN